jgi:hypothetical protein
MNIVKEEFWTKLPLPAMFIITTNGIIGDDGGLVMGMGIAREATKKIKDLQKICGTKIESTIKSLDKYNCKYLYYFLPVMETEGKNFLGLFQVKLDWKSHAKIDIVEKSCQGLLDYMNKHPKINYRMVYPAIGAGRLSIEKIHPILKKYFDNKDITICMREESYNNYLAYINGKECLEKTDAYNSSDCNDWEEERQYELGIDSSFDAGDYFDYEWRETARKINGTRIQDLFG